MARANALQRDDQCTGCLRTWVRLVPFVYVLFLHFASAAQNAHFPRFQFRGVSRAGESSTKIDVEIAAGETSSAVNATLGWLQPDLSGRTQKLKYNRCLPYTVQTPSQYRKTTANSTTRLQLAYLEHNSPTKYVYKYCFESPMLANRRIRRTFWIEKFWRDSDDIEMLEKIQHECDLQCSSLWVYPFRFIMQLKQVGNATLCTCVEPVTLFNYGVHLSTQNCNPVGRCHQAYTRNFLQNQPSFHRCTKTLDSWAVFVTDSPPYYWSRGDYLDWADASSDLLEVHADIFNVSNGVTSSIDLTPKLFALEYVLRRSIVYPYNLPVGHILDNHELCGDVTKYLCAVKSVVRLPHIPSVPWGVQNCSAFESGSELKLSSTLRESTQNGMLSLSLTMEKFVPPPGVEGPGSAFLECHTLKVGSDLDEAIPPIKLYDLLKDEPDKYGFLATDAPLWEVIRLKEGDTKWCATTVHSHCYAVTQTDPTLRSWEGIRSNSTLPPGCISRVDEQNNLRTRIYFNDLNSTSHCGSDGYRCVVRKCSPSIASPHQQIFSASSLAHHSISHVRNISGEAIRRTIQLSLGSSCVEGLYTVRCFAAYGHGPQHPTADRADNIALDRAMCLTGLRADRWFIRGFVDTEFVCASSKFSTERSFDFPVAPKFVFPMMNYKVLGPHVKSDFRTLETSRSAADQLARAVIGGASVSVVNSTPGSKVLVDHIAGAAVDATLPAKFSSEFSISGPALHDNSTHLDVFGSPFHAGYTHSWWAAKIYHSPLSAQPRSFHAIIESSSNVTMYLTNLSRLANVVFNSSELHYRCAVDGTQEGCFTLRADSVTSGRAVMWRDREWDIDTTFPSGENALYFHDAMFEDMAELHDFPTAPFPESGQGFAVSMWISWPQQKIETGAILLRAAGIHGEYMYVQSDPVVKGGLSFLVRLSDQFVRQVRTRDAVFQTDRWHHFAVAVEKSGNVSICIDGVRRPVLNYIGRNTLVSHVSATMATAARGGDDGIDSLVFWYTDGTYAIFPSGIPWTAYAEHNLTLPASHSGTLELRDVLVNDPLTLCVVCSQECKLSMSLKSAHAGVGHWSKETHGGHGCITPDLPRLNASERLLNFRVAVEHFNKTHSIRAFLSTSQGIMLPLSGRVGLDVYGGGIFEHITSFNSTTDRQTTLDLGDRVVKVQKTSTVGWNTSEATDPASTLVDGQSFQSQRPRFVPHVHENQTFDALQAAVPRPFALHRSQLDAGHVEDIDELTACMWTRIENTSSHNIILSATIPSPHGAARCKQGNNSFTRCGTTVHVGPSEENVVDIASPSVDIVSCHVAHRSWTSNKPTLQAVPQVHVSKEEASASVSVWDDVFEIKVITEAGRESKRIRVQRTDEAKGWGQDLTIYCYDMAAVPFTFALGTTSKRQRQVWPLEGITDASCPDEDLYQLQYSLSKRSAYCTPVLRSNIPQCSGALGICDMEELGHVVTPEACAQLVKSSLGDSYTAMKISYRSDAMQPVALLAAFDANPRRKEVLSQNTSVENSTIGIDCENPYNGTSCLRVMSGGRNVNLTLRMSYILTLKIGDNLPFVCGAIRTAVDTAFQIEIELQLYSTLGASDTQGRSTTVVSSQGRKWVYFCVQVGLVAWNDMEDETFEGNPVLTFQSHGDFDLDNIVLRESGLGEPGYNCSGISSLERVDTTQIVSNYEIAFIHDVPADWKVATVNELPSSTSQSEKDAWLSVVSPDTEVSTTFGKTLSGKEWHHVCVVIGEETGGMKYTSLYLDAAALDNGNPAPTRSTARSSLSKFTSDLTVIAGSAHVSDWKSIGSHETCHGYWRVAGQDRTSGGWLNSQRIGSVCPEYESCECQELVNSIFSAPASQYGLRGSVGDLSVYTRALTGIECRIHAGLSGDSLGWALGPAITLRAGFTLSNASTELVDSRRPTRQFPWQYAYRIAEKVACTHASHAIRCQDLDESSTCLIAAQALCDALGTCQYVSVQSAPDVSAKTNSTVEVPPRPRDGQNTHISQIHLDNGRDRVSISTVVRIRFWLWFPDTYYASNFGVHLVCHHVCDSLPPLRIYDRVMRRNTSGADAWNKIEMVYTNISRWRRGRHAIRCSAATMASKNDAITGAVAWNRGMSEDGNGRSFSNARVFFRCAFMAAPCSSSGNMPLPRAEDGFVGEKVSSAIEYVATGFYAGQGESWEMNLRNTSGGKVVELAARLVLVKPRPLRAIRFVNLCSSYSSANTASIHVRYESDDHSHLFNHFTLDIPDDCEPHMMPFSTGAKTVVAINMTIKSSAGNLSNAQQWKRVCRNCSVRWCGAWENGQSISDRCSSGKENNRINAVKFFNTSICTLTNVTVGRNVTKLATRMVEEIIAGNSNGTEIIKDILLSQSNCSNGTQLRVWNGTNVTIRRTCSNATLTERVPYNMTVCNETGNTTAQVAQKPEDSVSLEECWRRCLEMSACYRVEYSSAYHTPICWLMGVPKSYIKTNNGLLLNCVEGARTSGEGRIFGTRFCNDIISQRGSEVWELQYRGRLGLQEVRFLTENDTAIANSFSFHTSSGKTFSFGADGAHSLAMQGEPSCTNEMIVGIEPNARNPYFGRITSLGDCFPFPTLSKIPNVSWINISIGGRYSAVDDIVFIALPSTSKLLARIFSAYPRGFLEPDKRLLQPCHWQMTYRNSRKRSRWLCERMNNESHVIVFTQNTNETLLIWKFQLGAWVNVLQSSTFHISSLASSEMGTFRLVQTSKAASEACFKLDSRIDSARSVLERPGQKSLSPHSKWGSKFREIRKFENSTNGRTLDPALRISYLGSSSGLTVAARSMSVYQGDYGFIRDSCFLECREHRYEYFALQDCAPTNLVDESNLHRYLAYDEGKGTALQCACHYQKPSLFLKNSTEPSVTSTTCAENRTHWYAIEVSPPYTSAREVFCPFNPSYIIRSLDLDGDNILDLQCQTFIVGKRCRRADKHATKCSFYPFYTVWTETLLSGSDTPDVSFFRKSKPLEYHLNKSTVLPIFRQRTSDQPWKTDIAHIEAFGEWFLRPRNYEIGKFSDFSPHFIAGKNSDVFVSCEEMFGKYSNGVDEIVGSGVHFSSKFFDGTINGWCSGQIQTTDSVIKDFVFDTTLCNMHLYNVSSGQWMEKLQKTTCHGVNRSDAGTAPPHDQEYVGCYRVAALCEPDMDYSFCRGFVPGQCSSLGLCNGRRQYTYSWLRYPFKYHKHNRPQACGCIDRSDLSFTFEDRIEDACCFGPAVYVAEEENYRHSCYGVAIFKNLNILTGRPLQPYVFFFPDNSSIPATYDAHVDWPRNLAPIVGPFDISGPWEAVHQFAIPATSTSSPSLVSDVHLRLVDIQFDLWFFGDWNKENRDFLLYVKLNDATVWTLDDGKICSSKLLKCENLDAYMVYDNKVTILDTFRTDARPGYESLEPTSILAKYPRCSRKIQMQSVIPTESSSSPDHNAIRIGLVGPYQKRVLVGISRLEVKVNKITKSGGSLSKLVNITPGKSQNVSFVVENPLHFYREPLLFNAQLCRQGYTDCSASIEGSTTPALPEIKHVRAFATDTSRRVYSLEVETLFVVPRGIHGHAVFSQHYEDLLEAHIRMQRCFAYDCSMETEFIANVTQSGMLAFVNVTVADPLQAHRMSISICSYFMCSERFFFWTSGSLHTIQESLSGKWEVDSSNLGKGNISISITSTEMGINSMSRYFSWKHLVSNVTWLTLEAFVGCFNRMQLNFEEVSWYNDVNVASGDNKRLQTTTSCAIACKSRSYPFFEISEAGCRCGSVFPGNFGNSIVAPQHCLPLCQHEFALTPARYCGNNEMRAVWRTELVLLTTLGYTRPIANVELSAPIEAYYVDCQTDTQYRDEWICSEQITRSIGDIDTGVTFQTNTEVYAVFCNHGRYLMHSVQRVHERFPGLMPFHQNHFVCVNYDSSSGFWTYDDGTRPRKFVPTTKDLFTIVAILSKRVYASQDKIRATLQKPVLTTGINQKIGRPQIQVGFKKGNLRASWRGSKCLYGYSSKSQLRKTNQFAVACLEVRGDGFTPHTGDLLIWGSIELPSSSLQVQINSSISATHTNLKRQFVPIGTPAKNMSSMVPKSSIPDILGAVPISMTTQLCLKRGGPEWYTDECRTMPSTTLPVVNHRLSPIFPINVTNASCSSQLLLSWRPPIFWGIGALVNSLSRNFHVEIFREDSQCLAYDNQGLCQTLQSISYTDKNYWRVCRGHYSQFEMPMCGCQNKTCSLRATSQDFMDSGILLLSDLYTGGAYRFRMKATVEQRGDYRIIFDRPLMYQTTFSPWSRTMVVGNSGVPPPPPQPSVVFIDFTSVVFRIYRGAWNGSPITSYLFQMSADSACSDLTSLVWNEVEEVEVHVNSTFTPYIEFLRGNPKDGGLGSALEAGKLYHFRVFARNTHGLSRPSDYQSDPNPVRTGVVTFAALVWLENQHAVEQNITEERCGDINRLPPQCPSIVVAADTFYEAIEMKFALVPGQHFWREPVSFGREGAVVLGNTTDGSEDVVVNCMQSQCFKYCPSPQYSRGMLFRCFPPTELQHLTFTNASVIQNYGAVIRLVPAVFILQRRNFRVSYCRFINNCVANGGGGALAIERKSGGRASVVIEHSIFEGNHAVHGSGGALGPQHICIPSGFTWCTLNVLDASCGLSSLAGAAIRHCSTIRVISTRAIVARC